MDHLVAVEVIGDLPIVSVTGYRDVEEAQFGPNNAPLFDDAGNPVVRVVRVEQTQDVTKGGIAHLDPAKTNIAALTQSQLVKVVPKSTKKDAGKRDPKEA